MCVPKPCPLPCIRVISYEYECDCLVSCMPCQAELNLSSPVCAVCKYVRAACTRLPAARHPAARLAALALPRHPLGCMYEWSAVSVWI